MKRARQAEARLKWYCFGASAALAACGLMFLMASMPFAFILTLVGSIAFNLRAVNPR